MNRLRRFSTQSSSLHKRRSPFLSAGVPMLILLVSGTYFLSVFLDTHMKIKDSKNQSISTRKFNLEEEHKKVMKDLDLENFSLSRIPRPGEDKVIAETKAGKSSRTQ